MWLIPGKTKVRLEIFKDIGLADILIGLCSGAILTFLLLSNVPFRFGIALGILVVTALLLIRIDGEPNYILVIHLLRFAGLPRKFGKEGMTDAKHSVEQVTAFTDIEDDLISYNGQYYGAVLEIPAVEFRLFSAVRRNNTIVNGLGRVLRSVNPEWSVNIVKLERPVHYESYRANEEKKLEELRSAYESGVLSEEELKPRVEIIYERIYELDDLMKQNKVIVPFYYLVFYESDKRRLENEVQQAIDDLSEYEMHPVRVRDKELAIFLKYSNTFDVDEAEAEGLSHEDLVRWAMPDSVKINLRTTEVNGMICHNFRVNGYPSTVGEAWLASVMTIPGTKVVVKCKPMDMFKSVRNIDRSLTELRVQYEQTGVESRRLEIEEHIGSLTELLATLQGDNEILLETNIYVTAYDLAATTDSPKLPTPEYSDLPRVSNMKRSVKRSWRESRLRLVSLDCQELDAFIGSQVSNLDPCHREGRGIPANSLAACYPWVFANIADQSGDKLGSSEQVPVFVDFFKRDSERVNSNMMIVGKSGSGKSYATKSILTNLAADNCKIFILDPENEYEEMAGNLCGKYINVGNATQGRLNPFHIFTALDDEENAGATGSYAMHLQFLEEFFRQILPDCEKDALEYLNSIVDRMYMERGITGDTDLSKLKASDYPVFDELYDEILQEFQKADNEYIRVMLRTLMNYIAKFSTGGRNANIWNGPSTIKTEENFTVFNFQSLLANRNGTVANAQMLLVLKYIDNEIIKNREYNRRYNTNRRVAVVIDEAHVFIDEKFPVALDFMTKLAKQIRKYNGMQIVITQNIKDFVGNEEIARKSTAIINACQYSFIFALAPNDLTDLCTLYEKSGGINEVEQEQISSAPRGQAFTVLGPTARTTFKVETLESISDIFENPDRQTLYFRGEEGEAAWEEFLGESRELHESNKSAAYEEEIDSEPQNERSYVSFEVVSESEQETEADEDAGGSGVSGGNASDSNAFGSNASGDNARGNASGGAVTFERTAAYEAPSVIPEVEYTVKQTAPAAAAVPQSAGPERDSETDILLRQLLTSLSAENLEMKIREVLQSYERETQAASRTQLPEETLSRTQLPKETVKTDTAPAAEAVNSEDSSLSFDIFDEETESNDVDRIIEETLFGMVDSADEAPYMEDDDDLADTAQNTSFFDDVLFSDTSFGIGSIPTAELQIKQPGSDVADIRSLMKASGERTRTVTLEELRKFVTQRS